MERKLAAILAVDVVGYARLTEADEAGTFDRLKRRRKELFEPEIARHSGRIFKVMGDGLFVEFASVIKAVECSIALQDGMAERNLSVPESERFMVRIGVNMGDVIMEGSDRYGEGVNIASRLQGLAEPGGVCISGKVFREVEKKLPIAFEPLGGQQLKNIDGPIECYRWKPRSQSLALPGDPLEIIRPEEDHGSNSFASHLTSHVTGWVIGGAVLALTGIAPEQWFARIVEAIPLPMPRFDFRLALALTGLGIIALDVTWRFIRDATSASITGGRARAYTALATDFRTSRPLLGRCGFCVVGLLAFSLARRKGIVTGGCCFCADCRSRAAPGLANTAKRPSAGTPPPVPSRYRACAAADRLGSYRSASGRASDEDHRLHRGIEGKFARRSRSGGNSAG